MDKKDSKIWIWTEDNKLFKAVYSSSDGCLTIYNEYDEIIIRRKHIPLDQMNAIELVFLKKHAKRIDNSKGSFTYIDNN